MGLTPKAQAAKAIPDKGTTQTESFCSAKGTAEWKGTYRAAKGFANHIAGKGFISKT